LSSGPSINSRRASSVSNTSEPTDTYDFPYDVRDEASPLEPFFTLAFQVALQNGLAIAKDTVAAIERVAGSFGLRDELARLLEDARDLSTFECSDTRTVAVLGDSGEGKDKGCYKQSFR
jgi:hypothetical protein